MATPGVRDDPVAMIKWQKMRKAFKKGGAVVLVGVQGRGATLNRDGLTNVALATIHEFGVPESKIPERSFIRATIDANQAKYFRFIQKLSGKVILGEMSEERALNLLGLLVVSDIQARIEAGIEPDLKPATIARKGSSTPLIDSGILKNSITHEVEKKR